jgi:hypothetical protein
MSRPDVRAYLPAVLLDDTPGIGLQVENESDIVVGIAGGNMHVEMEDRLPGDPAII